MSFRLTGSPDYSYTPQPDGGEISSQLIALVAASIMCSLFGIKTYNVQYKYLSYSRILVLLLYICSWAFTVTGLILMSTNNGNYLSCLLSELSCDIFYSGTKILMYCWLIEKVWVVNAGRTTRWHTKSYRLHTLLLTPYIVIFVLMIYFHNAWLEEDGLCIIGLKPIASIPLLVYDFVFNLYMTVLFVLPLIKIGHDTNVDWKQTRLHEVAKKTMMASVVCLIVSFANVTALAVLGGTERGVLCLTCCFVDVMINVVTVHWVTSQPATGKATRDTIMSYNHPQSKDQTSHSSDQSSQKENIIPTDKKKRFRFDPVNEQYGEFGHQQDKTPQYTNQMTSNYNVNQYMSATGNKIYTSPAIHQSPQQLPAYQPSSMPYHFMNGRFVMVSEREDDDFQTSSHSSSIQDSRRSLTKTPSSTSSHH
ncbi:uncharacterized protein BX664DRAFT_330687 [Halteromyces radiatus]|uniref:uncharacterized protein n=1 Tax=Halteromyces radiatus TaxID=101107 RepID=UPI00221EC9EE|nr:uncharacterized protein BX664DRAFT_330687 [Halteromyces radiatus]KAI8093831.1 hypothetical protein BX664DRAFT_330687 [Halteromyces radiatus]